MKWSRQKFTFMVIPDANNQVVRFQLSAILLLSALIFLVVLAASAATAIILYGNRSGEVGRLKYELAAAAGQYEKAISDKEKHIGDLETEVAGFSEQAKSIQDKMADIHKLETQLKEIAGIDPSGASDVKNAPDTSGLDGGYSMDAAGGEELPVTDEATDVLMQETHQEFSAIAGLIDQLKPRLEQTKIEVMRQQKLLQVTPTIWPTDSRKVTSPFGIRRDPFTHRATFHAGVDISGDSGDSIYAAADGIVTHAERDGAHGNNVILSHGNGIITHYSHMRKILAESGTKVRKGDIIGEMGSTGRSTGPHLHYEVSVRGNHVDPKPYLRATRKG